MNLFVLVCCILLPVFANRAALPDELGLAVISYTYMSPEDRTESFNDINGFSDSDTPVDFAKKLARSNFVSTAQNIPDYSQSSNENFDLSRYSSYLNRYSSSLQNRMRVSSDDGRSARVYGSLLESYKQIKFNEDKFNGGGQTANIDNALDRILHTRGRDWIRSLNRFATDNRARWNGRNNAAHGYSIDAAKQRARTILESFPNRQFDLNTFYNNVDRLGFAVRLFSPQGHIYGVELPTPGRTNHINNIIKYSEASIDHTLCELPGNPYEDD